jgi:hypothetical protein
MFFMLGAELELRTRRRWVKAGVGRLEAGIDRVALTPGGGRHDLRRLEAQRVLERVGLVPDHEDAGRLSSR